jgi:hypothetical protein
MPIPISIRFNAALELLISNAGERRERGCFYHLLIPKNLV